MDRQLQVLRTVSARVCARPELPIDVRELFAHLVGIVGELHLQVDWLRSDLAKVGASPAAAAKAH